MAAATPGAGDLVRHGCAQVGARRVHARFGTPAARRCGSGAAVPAGAALARAGTWIAGRALRSGWPWSPWPGGRPGCPGTATGVQPGPGAGARPGPGLGRAVRPGPRPEPRIGAWAEPGLRGSPGPVLATAEAGIRSRASPVRSRPGPMAAGARPGTGIRPGAGAGPRAGPRIGMTRPPRARGRVRTVLRAGRGRKRNAGRRAVAHSPGLAGTRFGAEAGPAARRQATPWIRIATGGGAGACIPRPAAPRLRPGTGPGTRAAAGREAAARAGPGVLARIATRGPARAGAGIPPWIAARHPARIAARHPTRVAAHSARIATRIAARHSARAGDPARIGPGDPGRAEPGSWVCAQVGPGQGTSRRARIRPRIAGRAQPRIQAGAPARPVTARRARVATVACIAVPAELGITAAGRPVWSARISRRAIPVVVRGKVLIGATAWNGQAPAGVPRGSRTAVAHAGLSSPRHLAGYAATSRKFLHHEAPTQGPPPFSARPLPASGLLRPPVPRPPAKGDPPSPAPSIA